MDWVRAIERNREALGAIIALLFAMLGGAAERVTPGFHRAVDRVLGPTESAVRRLIVIAARGLVARPSRARPVPKLPATGRRSGHLAFRLFDRRKHFAALAHGRGPPPRIHILGSDPRIALFQPKPPPLAIPSPDDGLIASRRLHLRLEAVARALGDLPREARRLARWRARREQVPHLKYVSPLRPGPPPGHRRTRVHDIDFILAECHGLARDAAALDTS